MAAGKRFFAMSGCLSGASRVDYIAWVILGLIAGFIASGIVKRLGEGLMP
jgi:hypothetical protein